jgi:hypothetical protein
MGDAKRRKQQDPNWQKNRHPRFKVSKVRMITREIDLERDADDVPSCGGDDMREIKQKYAAEGRGVALSVEGHSELAYLSKEKLITEVLINSDWDREVLAPKMTKIIDSYNPETEFITLVASKKVDEYMVMTTQFE